MNDNEMLLSISRSSSGSGPNFSSQGCWTIVSTSLGHFDHAGIMLQEQSMSSNCDSVEDAKNLAFAAEV